LCLRRLIKKQLYGSDDAAEATYFLADTTGAAICNDEMISIQADHERK